jgi:hypothetical protein
MSKYAIAAGIVLASIMPTVLLAAPSVGATGSPEISIVDESSTGQAAELSPLKITVMQPISSLATASLTRRAAAPNAEPAPTVVATGTTDAEGRASLRVAPSPMLIAEAAANDGWVNFEAEDGETAQFYSFSRRWDGTNWVDRSGANSVVKIDTAAPDPADGGAPNAVRAAAVAEPAVPAAGFPHTTCMWWGPTSATTANTVIGQVHAGADTHVSFSYGETADSDIDVGYAHGSGSFVPSGSAHVGTSAGAEIGFDNKGPNWRHKLESGFQYIKYEYIHSADCPDETGRTGRYDYKVVVNKWTGGATVGADKSGTYCPADAPNLADYDPGTHLRRYKSRAYHFTAGVDAFGATLGATSGYSNNAEFTMTFGTAKAHHWICGNNAAVTTSSLVWAR